MFSNKKTRYILIVCLWLAVWEAVSLLVGNSILLVGPWDVVCALAQRCTDASFYESIGMSMLKICLGYVCGAILGMILAAVSYRYATFADILKAPMAFIKAAPVASFVVLFLIWWHSSVLSVAICICVVLPQIYVSVLEGLNGTDKKLLEMARVYELSTIDRINYIYRPSVCSHLEGAVRISAGMAWKSGVAAEVIGTPDMSVGGELYMSKIYLDTAGVLAWTAVIIILSVIGEKILLRILNVYASHEFRCKGAASERRKMTAEDKLKLEGISKKFGDLQVLDAYSQTVSVGVPYIYDWPSGAGKTTLFRIIAGLEKADEGTISPKEYKVTMLFQEERLIENFSAVKNAELICGDPQKAEKLLLSVLDEEDIYRPVCELSGGQRRRVSAVMACASDADVVLLDEPYEGLDENAKTRTQSMLTDYGRDKIVLTASHIDANV